MAALLEAKGVSKIFGGLVAVDNVDMTVNKGDIFGIIGPNGAGKTTFFNICTGFYTPSQGAIYLEGQKISGLPCDQIAKKGIARTFQNIQLFKYMSVLDNVKIGFHINTRTNLFDAIVHSKTYKNDEKVIKEKGYAILEEVGLSKYADTMAGNLPYGVQRKVEIARALALEPKILLLDEPAAGMNPNETDSLMQFMLMLKEKGHTITVIEHDMKFVMNSCNHILVLNFGQKICEGTPDDVKNNEQVKEAYFGKGIIAARGTN
ncbi:MAG: ABC-type branched-chain amino acid transport system, ATPase component [Lachnospiraceae bacterium]|jgi:branched-chain amino acid transport system ATP-binding protein|nr:ABC-type branched-chain amino acid transport system, ATPase component [Lachnospiraceae bacterium]